MSTATKRPTSRDESIATKYPTPAPGSAVRREPGRACAALEAPFEETPCDDPKLDAKLDKPAALVTDAFVVVTVVLTAAPPGTTDAGMEPGACGTALVVLVWPAPT